jgi:ATP-dependent RNA helicase DDX56/DBP9
MLGDDDEAAEAGETEAEKQVNGDDDAETDTKRPKKKVKKSKGGDKEYGVSRGMFFLALPNRQ